jgi:hypothetical protein
VIEHRMTGQVAHTHATADDVMACELDWLDTLDRFAQAFEDVAA